MNVDDHGYPRVGSRDIELVAHDAELERDHDRALLLRLQNGVLLETKHANGLRRMISAITMRFYRRWLLNRLDAMNTTDDDEDLVGSRMMLMRVDEAEVMWRIFFAREYRNRLVAFEPTKPWKPEYVTWKVQT